MDQENYKLEPTKEEPCPNPIKSKTEKKTDPAKYKKGGSAGSKGVEYQIRLLAVVILNAIKSTLTKWKLSTENDEAGKFDDIVLEWTEGAVLIQSKHKENNKKRITLEELTSTNSKSDDFSLPKYFLSYMSIKEKFNIRNLIICTNAGVHEKVLKFLNELTTNTESLLHHEDDECSFYTLNYTILPVLEEKTILYYDQNFKNKGIPKSVITEENLSDFLKRLQLFFDYSSLTDLEKITENLLSLTECCSNSLGHITQREMFPKLMHWFQQKEGVYFTEIHAKAMFAEIWTNKYCEKLKRYKISLQKNNLSFHGTKQIFHITSSHGNLLQAIKVYYTVENKKILFVNPDDDIDTQKLILEAFALPRYAFLVINQPKIMEESVIIEMCAKLRDILCEKKHKKVVLMTRNNDAFSRNLLHKVDYETINEPVKFTDFSYSFQEKLLKTRSVIFQGKSVCLEELIASRITEDYANAVDQDILENIIAGNINVGAKPSDMDENIAPFYIKRTFKRSMKNIHEKDVYDVKEKVVLISDNAGVGKTTVLSKLATNIKERNPHLWVINIALTEYTQLLRDLKDSEESISVMKLLNSKNATRLTNHLERFVFSIEGKVVLMLDGVDEISPDYTELVHNLLTQCLRATNFAKLFVTTRPHMMPELNKIFKVDAFELQPFAEQNQVRFLIGYWTHKLNIPQENKERCEKYARELIERMSSWTEGDYYGQQKFTAIALQLRMVAEIFEETITLNKFSYWEGCKEYSESVSESPNLPREIELKELYDLFIERKRHIYIRKGNPSGNSEANTALNTKFNDSLAYHKKLALEVILNKKNRQLISCYQKSLEVINESVLKIGIVQGSNKRFYFIHRTFAEYFVAESIISELQLQSENPNLQFQKFFIHGVLRESNYEIIRAFIESFLQNAVDSIPSNIFKSYQSKSANNFGTDEDRIINVLFGEGHVTILQLIFKCINFKISDEDLPQQKNMTLKNFLQTIKRKNTAKNRLYALRMLLQDKGLEFRDSDGNTPLAAAARGGHLKMVRFLIDLGAKVNSANKDGSTVLHLAINGGHMDIVKHLVQHEAEINCRSKKGYTPLHIAAVRSDLKCVNYFIESGADLSIRDNRDRTLLHIAAMGRQFYPIDFLHKLDEDHFYRFNNYPMYLTLAKEQRAIIELPVKHGEDIDVKDEDGCTPLHFAAKYSHVNTLILLHKLGGNLNIRNNFGRTPLHSAADAEHLDVIDYLGQVGADLNITDIQGWTALHSAVSDGRHLDVIKYLSEAGADLNITDDRGWTALHSAAAAGYLDVVKYLVEAGVDLNITDNCGGNALHLAAKFGHYDNVKYLIKFNKDVDVKDNDGYTPLLLAASKGHTDVVKLLQQHNASVDIVLHVAVEIECTDEYFLNCVANVNIRDNNGSTALHLAAKEGRMDAVNSLCKIGADLNITDNHGKTALHLAAEKSQWRTIKVLHNFGADLDVRDGSGRTALHSAATTSVVRALLECRADLNRNNCSWMKLHSAVVSELWSTLQYLIKAGADLNITDDRGETVLHSAAASGNLILVKYLHQAGADLNVKDISGMTALHLAAFYGHLDVVKYLREGKAELNVTDNNGETALYSAAAYGQLHVVKYLFEAGAALHITDDGDDGYLDVVDNLLKAEADLNITDDHGLRPLRSSVASVHWDLVEYLNEGGADLNVTDVNGETVLYSAAFYGHLDVVKSLLEAGADLNITDDHGTTALHSAATVGHLDVVKFCIEADADLNITDNRGRTALHSAASNEHLDIIKSLIEAGADLNIKDDSNRTALYSAASEGRLDVVKSLIEAGADSNITGDWGWTPLHEAVACGQLDVVKYLRKAGADFTIKDRYGRTPMQLANFKCCLQNWRLL